MFEFLSKLFAPSESKVRNNVIRKISDTSQRLQNAKVRFKEEAINYQEKYLKHTQKLEDMKERIPEAQYKVMKERIGRLTIHAKRLKQAYEQCDLKIADLELRKEIAEMTIETERDINGQSIGSSLTTIREVEEEVRQLEISAQAITDLKFEEIDALPSSDMRLLGNGD